MDWQLWHLLIVNIVFLNLLYTTAWYIIYTISTYTNCPEICALINKAYRYKVWKVLCETIWSNCWRTEFLTSPRSSWGFLMQLEIFIDHFEENQWYYCHQTFNMYFHQNNAKIPLDNSLTSRISMQFW